MPSTFRLISPPAHAAQLGRARSTLRSESRLTPGHWRAATAHLMCGDFDAVRASVRDAHPQPALPLVAARYHAWTGDLRTVMGIFEQVRLSLPLLDDADPELRTLTWPELERLVTDVGDPVMASRLARLAREQPRRAAAAGDDAASVIIRYLDELLEPEPDAHRGRLRLRPRLGPHEEIRVIDLRFGDGSVSLTAAAVADRLTITVVQEAGALPFTLLLEPVVTRPVAAVAVDGRAAQLDVRPHGDHLLVPVQLVLDAERTLEIELETQ